MVEDPLLMAIEEYWRLDKAKETFLPAAIDQKLPLESRRELALLQQSVRDVFNRIRELSANSPEARSAKIGVLKYRARATEFEDTEIFRELVFLLDELDVWQGDDRGRRWQHLHKKPEEKKPWRFNLNNIFNLHNIFW